MGNNLPEEIWLHVCEIDDELDGDDWCSLSAVNSMFAVSQKYTILSRLTQEGLEMLLCP